MFFQNIPLYTVPKETVAYSWKTRAHDDLDVFCCLLHLFMGEHVEFQDVSHITSTKTSLWVDSYIASLEKISPVFSICDNRRVEPTTPQ